MATVGTGRRTADPLVNGQAQTRQKLKDIVLMNKGQLERLGQITSELNPTILSRIFREAERPGELGALFELYHKIEKYDGKIGGLVQKRRKAPTKFPVKLVAKDNEEGSSEIKEKLEKVIADMDMKKLMRSSMNGVLHGVTLMENIWEREGDDLVFRQPIEISSSRYGQFNDDIFGNSTRWGELYIKTGRHLNDKLFIEDIESYKLHKVTYSDKKGFFDIAGILRPIIKWYLFKYFVFQYWIEFDETYGFPTTVLNIPKSDYYEFKTELEEMMLSVGRNKFGILFEGMEYKVHSQQSAGQVEFFDRLAKRVNEEITFGILGHNLSEGGQQGSFAQSVVGYDMDTDLIIDDSEIVDHAINKNIIEPFIMFNYPDNSKDVVKLLTNTPERKDWTKIRQKWETAAKLSLKGVSKKQIAEDLEIEFAEDGEDSVDLYWQERPNGGEQKEPEIRNEERKDGGSVSDDNTES